jgi:hypothetical protein
MVPSPSVRDLLKKKIILFDLDLAIEKFAFDKNWLDKRNQKHKAAQLESVRHRVKRADYPPLCRQFPGKK